MSSGLTDVKSEHFRSPWLMSLVLLVFITNDRVLCCVYLDCMNDYLLTLSTLSACSLYQAWTGRHGAQECNKIIIRIFAGNYSHSILKILAT